MVNCEQNCAEEKQEEFGVIYFRALWRGVLERRACSEEVVIGWAHSLYNVILEIEETKREGRK